MICAQVRVPPGPRPYAAPARRGSRGGGLQGERDHDPRRQLRQLGLRRRLDGDREAPRERGLGPPHVGAEHAPRRRPGPVSQRVLPHGLGEQLRGPRVRRRRREARRAPGDGGPRRARRGDGGRACRDHCRAGGVEPAHARLARRLVGSHGAVWKSSSYGDSIATTA